MSQEPIEIRCIVCGHKRYVPLDELGGAERVVYRGPTRQETYRVACPRCGTRQVVTIEVEEEDG